MRSREGCSALLAPSDETATSSAFSNACSVALCTPACMRSGRRLSPFSTGEPSTRESLAAMLWCSSNTFAALRSARSGFGSAMIQYV